MNASFEITPQKLAQNWQPKASSRQLLLEALMGLLQLAPKLAWQNWRKIGAKLAWQKRSWLYSVDPPRFGVDKMEQLLTAVIVAPFVITMIGFAVAIAFAPAVPNEIAPATDHDDSRHRHRAKPRRWSGKA